MDDPRPLQARVEDYHSSAEDSDHDSAAETFRRSPVAPGQANVAAKRSHPSDLGTDNKAPGGEKMVNVDQQSDSGYSSHTAATMSSADSAPSAKASQSPPSATVNVNSNANAAPPTQPSPAIKRRPTISKGDRQDSHSSPRKPLRSGSVSSRNRPPKDRQSQQGVAGECTDPDCTVCGLATGSSRGRKSKQSPLDSGLDLSGRPSDQRSQRSDPATASSSRQPDPYTRGPAVIQPGQTARRRPSSTTRAPRPASFGGELPQGYWVPGIPHPPYPSPPHDQHGPPPAMSAYMHHPHMGGYPILGATPPNAGFYQPTPMQVSPQYEQRPPMSARNSSFNTRARPTSQMYGPPLLTQDLPANMPSARYPSNTPSSAAQIKSHFETETSESEYSEEEYDHDRALMPPPQLKTLQRRPSDRRSKTYDSERRKSMSQSLTFEPPRDRERDPRASQMSTVTPSRSASISRSRPALVQYPKAQSAFETTRSAQVMVENSRDRRRRSYQSYGTESDRLSKVYSYEDRQPHHRRRQTDTNASRRDERSGSKFQEVADDVEAYQQRMRGNESPFNDHVHKAAKRASRIPSGHSENGSSRSKGSDKASRVSRRTTVTNGNGGGGEIRLRVDASAPVNLQFNGDMEGRTLQINPTEDGMADIVIGSNNRGRENMYRSERGSALGSSKRSVVSRSERPERPERPRRDTEEASNKSSRSSQSRRDREWDTETRPLRRQKDLSYY